MRCRFCGGFAGLRRRCKDCRCLWNVFQQNRGGSMRTLLNRFADTGVDPAKIERFLRVEPKKAGGSLLDQIAAEAANELLGALGQAPRQDGALVKQLRDRGLWRRYDERPAD